MSAQSFKLSINTDELREIYKDKLNFRVFSGENYFRVILAVFFFILLLVSIIKTNSDEAFFFISLCFFAGFGYHLIMLLKEYLRFKKNAKEIENWIRFVNTFKSHSIAFEQDSFKYYRDHDVFSYNIKSVKTTYRTDSHFYFATTDNIDIILPRGAFESGEFEKFLKCFDERIK